MDTREDFVRTSLRIPKNLHERLLDAAGRRNSLNAEIIHRLELSFTPYADPGAIPKAYDHGRRDALIARPIRGGDYVDPFDSEESTHDMRVLFEGLPASLREAVINLLRGLAEEPAGKAKGGE